MHRFALLSLVLVAAAPQDGDWSARRKESGAEKPCCKDGVAKPWAQYNKALQWTQPNDKAAEAARADGKLLMVFHLVGDMDKEGC